MPAGRPRTFDVDHALDQALTVFWRKGFEGASLPDLTEAMGINRPSLYAAFGNKEALFRKALDRYQSGPAGYFERALQAPTARQAVEQILRQGIELITQADSPHGCFLVHGALACGESGDAVKKELAKRRAEGEAAVAARFTQAVAEGDLPAEIDPKSLAKYLCAVVYGLAVLAAGGAKRDELHRVSDFVLQSFPGR